MDRSYSHSLIFRCPCYIGPYYGITEIHNSDNRYILSRYIEVIYFKNFEKTFIIHCDNCKPPGAALRDLEGARSDLEGARREDDFHFINLLSD